MKKAIVILAALALLTSCSKSDKCKCTFKVGPVTLEDQIVPRPDEKNCSELKIEDIDGEYIDIDLSKIGSVKCVNHKD